MKEDLDTLLTLITTPGTEYDEILNNILGYQHIDKKNELISEISISYLENREKMNDIIQKGYFKYYFITTVKNQVKSSTSSFYKNVRIRDFDNHEEFEDIKDDWDFQYKQEQEEKWEVTNDIRKKTKMTYFESEMIRLYYDENMTYREIAEEYELNHTLIFQTVKDVIIRMKKQVE